ncbi:MmcQ/YjbR family DNA-binding protein [Litoribacillus peritrichatus]|uniref:MmcQ/YjbR family DNA-binding protein n=1 Tax=Litoribacillus peritrichatus TaxID=718191 RepID=A0ABP7MKC9_9GAMM
MNINQLKAYCNAFPGASENLSGAPINVLSYKVHGKQFAYFKTSEPEQWRFSFRATFERFLELTDQPGIKPARYLQRFYWVTVVDVQTINEEYLKELVEWSYHKAVSGLPKKVQAEINAICSVNHEKRLDEDIQL